MYSRFCFLLLFLLGYKIQAQQNLFNVPSGEITKKNKCFFQYQWNVNSVIQNNLTFDYGLGKNWEIGANLFGANFNTNKNEPLIQTNTKDFTQPLNPQCLFNIQKSFHINHVFKFSVGTQSGFALSKRIKDDELITYNWGILTTNLMDEKLQLISGVYAGDYTYLGSGDKIGFLTGVEWTITPKIHFVGDAIWGKNSIAVGVLGGSFFIKKNLAVSCGWQIPMPHVNANNALVLELTFL